MSFVKNLVRRSVRGLGYDLRKRRPELIDFLKARRINVVFDVGANRGQFGAMLRADGYCGSIVSFEPANEPLKELMRRMADDKKWTAHNFALGESTGLTRLNVSKEDTFSSILPLAENAASFDLNSRVDHVEEVEIFRMDDVCRLQYSDRAFLKIDTQGFEKQVLNGASTILQSLLGVLLEIPVVHLYENVWNLEECVSYMRSVKFVLAQVKPVNYLGQQDPVSVCDLDCVFRRISEIDW
jgi:FkbM family methyltransferase